MSPEEIEKAEVALQKAELALEQRRLEVDRKASELDRNFLNKNTGVLISAAVSLAAVVVSLGQVWSTNISKDKELELSNLQHKADAATQERQRDRELAITDSQRKRELDITAIRFITENRKAIFDGSAEDRELFAKLIPTLFPPEVAAPLLTRIEKATPGPDSKIWQDARKQAVSGAVFSRDGRYFVTSSENSVRMWDSASSREIRRIATRGIVSAVAFSPDGRQLLVTTLDGSIERWDLVTGQLISQTRAQ